MASHAEALVFDDLAVVAAYLALLAATVFHALLLLPSYTLPPLHRTLVFAVSVGLVIYSLWGIWRRVHWAGTGG